MNGELAPEEVRRHHTHLAELQRIDVERKQIRRRLDTAPRQIEGLNRDVAAAEKTHSALAAQVEEHARERREQDRGIREREEKIRALEQRMLTITSQRGFEAVRDEMRSLRSEIGELEDRAFAILEEEEQATAQADREMATLEALRAKAQAETGRLEATREEDLATLEVLERDRTRFAGELPEAILDRYEVLRGRHPTSAVVFAAEDQTCGGCRMNLVQQTLLDLASSTRLTLCEHCGRILLPPEKPATSETA
jgi:predicted  nucleic acid-binding Zn-ribbon protein